MFARARLAVAVVLGVVAGAVAWRRGTSGETESESLGNSDESASEFQDWRSELPLPVESLRPDARKKGRGGRRGESVLSSCSLVYGEGLSVRRGSGEVRCASSSLLWACEELGGDGLLAGDAARWWWAGAAERRWEVGVLEGLWTAR